ncbi:mCG147138 [Mus musculus]|nr:mCG147138 [Mus musculus]
MLKNNSEVTECIIAVFMCLHRKLAIHLFHLSKAKRIFVKRKRKGGQKKNWYLCVHFNFI